MTNKPKLQRRKVINVPVRAVFMGVSSACLGNLKQFRDRKAVAARSYRGGLPSPGPAGAPRRGLLRTGVYNRDYERTPEAVAVIGAEQGWRGLITPAFPRDKGQILTM